MDNINPTIRRNYRDSTSSGEKSAKSLVSNSGKSFKEESRVRNLTSLKIRRVARIKDGEGRIHSFNYIVRFSIS